MGQRTGCGGGYGVRCGGRGWLGAGLLLLALGGCSAESPPQESAAARGEKVYRNVCTTCHNVDPNLDGTLGPAIAGSSRELLEARVLRSEYPPGYTPKRPSQVMPKFPYLEGAIDDLAAYLAEAAKN